MRGIFGPSAEDTGLIVVGRSHPVWHALVERAVDDMRAKLDAPEAIFYTLSMFANVVRPILLAEPGFDMSYTNFQVAYREAVTTICPRSIALRPGVGLWTLAAWAEEIGLTGLIGYYVDGDNNTTISMSDEAALVLCRLTFA